MSLTTWPLGNRTSRLWIGVESALFFLKRIFIPETDGAVSIGKNAINSVGKLIAAPYAVCHAIISMWSAALKVQGDVTAADDALAFLVGGCNLLTEGALLACDEAVHLRERVLLSRSSQSD
jgi:hypothetical protein